MSDKHTILVVEDELIVARDIQLTLQHLGYHVPVVVATGEKALQQAEELRPDLILMDIILKGKMDGIQAATQIRDRFAIPVVYLTGHTDAPTLERAKQAEPFGYIVKPFEEQEIHSTIQMALYKSEAQKRLRESESRYRSVVEGSLQGIAIIQDGALQYVNPAYAKIFGYASGDELLGQPPEHALTRELVAPMRELWATCLRGAQVPAQPAWQGLRKDGGLLWLESTVSAFTWRQQPAVLVFVLDISERKNLEEQLLHAQKMEAIGQLAGGVAHDFNNLLTVITGFSEFLLTRFPARDPTRDALKEIRKAGERAATLTRQLLAFSRKQVLAPVLLNPNAIIEDMHKMLPRLLSEDIALAVELEPAVGTVKVDPGQLEQVVLNLVVNARDAMPLGGALRIATRQVELTAADVQAYPEVKPGPYVLLQVSDTGCGIAEHIKPRIFEPFFTTKEHGKGTGLGLAIVYGVIKQSEGHIELDSAPGRGTTFKLYLPRLPVELAPTSASYPEIHIEGGTETVLLVEDEETVRILAKMALEMNGYKVLDAANGERALTIAAELLAPIDIVVTDVVMPQLGGRRLVDMLLKRQPKLKILYLSGHTDDAILRHGVLQEKIAFLPKPYTPTQIAAKVREVLDKH